MEPSLLTNADPDWEAHFLHYSGDVVPRYVRKAINAAKDAEAARKDGGAGDDTKDNEYFTGPS
jgi:ubiquinone biosynthesis protein UbiJ